MGRSTFSVVFAVLAGLGCLGVAGSASAASLPAEAAAPLSAHVVGGTATAPGAAPWAAFVEYAAGGGDYELCSGTVVAPTLVLTAGHCAADETTGVPNPAAGYAVVTGSQNWANIGAEQISAVKAVDVYSGYMPATDDGDAALLQLSTPTTAPAVPLASNPTDAALLEAGTPAVVEGYGVTDPATDVASEQLESGQEVVQSAGTCGSKLALSNYPFDSFDELCAIDAPTFADGTCSGDSGGPLLTQRADGAWVEIGLTIRGPASCSATQPDVFMNVALLDPWIERTIDALATPSASTGSATVDGASEALLNGDIDTNGGSASYYFQYGTDTSYGSTTTSLPALSGTSPEPVNALVSNLSPSTTYHFRLVATNANGTVYGADQSFTTPSPPAVLPPAATPTTTTTTPAPTATSPSTTTTPAAATTTPTTTVKPASAAAPTFAALLSETVRARSARLTGSLHVHGQRTHYYFEYGMGSGYSHRTTVSTTTGAAATLRPTVMIARLKPATVYHFRLVATAGGRTFYSPAKRFETRSASR